jgi:hypothetical protein
MMSSEFWKSIPEILCTTDFVGTPPWINHNLIYEIFPIVFLLFPYYCSTMGMMRRTAGQARNAIGRTSE